MTNRLHVSLVCLWFCAHFKNILVRLLAYFLMIFSQINICHVKRENVCQPIMSAVLFDLQNLDIYSQPAVLTDFTFTSLTFKPTSITHDSSLPPCHDGVSPAINCGCRMVLVSRSSPRARLPGFDLVNNVPCVLHSTL